MAKRQKKRISAKVATKSRKTKKAIAVKTVKPRKPATKKRVNKVTRRSTAEVAKLRKAVLAGARTGKTAETIAAELGISKAYVYALKNRT